jgi:hypothetical protein
MEHLDGIINKERNPFICDSWIEQGYRCTPHRIKQLKKIISLTQDEIRSRPRNEGVYVAFVAIRWKVAAFIGGKLKLL